MTTPAASKEVILWPGCSLSAAGNRSLMVQWKGLELVEHGHTTQITASSLIGLILGYWAKVYALGMVAVPGWFPYLIQGSVTLIVASITVVVSHFLKRWLDRRWPNLAKRD